MILLSRIRRFIPVIVMGVAIIGTPFIARAAIEEGTAPATPAGLTATAINGGATLVWQDAVTATGYHIYKSTDNVTFTLFSSPTETTTTATGLLSGVAVYFKVSAYNLFGESLLSTAVSVVPHAISSHGVSAIPASVPIASLVVTAPNGGEQIVGGSMFTVTWSLIGTGIDHLRILLSNDGGLSFSSVVTENASPVGNYDWVVPAIMGDQFRIRLEGLSADNTMMLADISDANFTIVLNETHSEPASSAPHETPGVTTGDSFDVSVATTTSPTINDDLKLGPPVAHATCPSNTLFREFKTSTVYYCGANGKRYLFPNEGVYFSWYQNFNTVSFVDEEHISGSLLGGVITYRPGVRMVKIESNPRVYATGPGGLLRWITTEAIAEKLYGSQWRTFVVDLPLSFNAGYHFGPDITQ